MGLLAAVVLITILSPITEPARRRMPADEAKLVNEDSMLNTESGEKSTPEPESRPKKPCPSICVLMMGIHGSGKGTQAKRLIEEYELEHLSAGDIIRRERKMQTPMGQKIDKVYAEAEKTGEKYSAGPIITEMVLGCLEELVIRKQGFILDGFPRTMDQAVALTDFFERVGIPVIKVELKLTREQAEARIKDRNRSDDNNDQRRQERLNNFFEIQEPMMEKYFEDRYVIDATGSIVEVSEAMKSLVAKHSE